MITREYLLINGYGQSARSSTGLGVVARELLELGQPTQLRQWRVNIAGEARALASSPHPLVIAGYSYGGATAVLIARELERLGRQVAWLILADAVYRLRQRLASLRSLLDHWTLTISANVCNCVSWRQSISKPAGHRVIASGNTSLDSRTLLVPHTQVHKAPEIRRYILELARR